MRNRRIPFHSTFTNSFSISKFGENSVINYQPLGVHRRKSSYGNPIKKRENSKKIRYKSKENFQKIVNQYKRSKSISGKSKKIEFPSNKNGKIYYDIFRVQKGKNEKLAELMKIYKEKNYKEALKFGETLLENENKNLDCLYIVGLSASMIEDYDKTILHFEKLIKISPKFKKNVYLFLSIAYKKKEDFTKGVFILDKGIENFKKFYEAYVNIKINLLIRFTRGNYC